MTNDLMLKYAADLEAIGAPSATRASVPNNNVAWPSFTQLAELWKKTQALIAELKSNDLVVVKATNVAKLVREIINVLLGDSGGGELVFQTAHALGDGSWVKKIGGILSTLLPLILALA